MSHPMFNVDSSLQSQRGKKFVLEAGQGESNVVVPERSSNFYLTESDRFHKDFAAEERQRRAQSYNRQQEKLQVKRDRMVNRDQDRWRAMNNEEDRKQQKLVNKASKWKPGQSNNLSAAYNPITLQYDDTTQGTQLKHKDDFDRYKAGMRMFNIDARMNSDYNIINGESRKPPEIPRRPF